MLIKKCMDGLYGSASLAYFCPFFSLSFVIPFKAHIYFSLFVRLLSLWLQSSIVFFVFQTLASCLHLALCEILSGSFVIFLPPSYRNATKWHKNWLLINGHCCMLNGDMTLHLLVVPFGTFEQPALLYTEEMPVLNFVQKICRRDWDVTVATCRQMVPGRPLPTFYPIATCRQMVSGKLLLTFYPIATCRQMVPGKPLPSSIQ